ncbi:putative RNA-binding protein [Trypanosoma grayi]|uniref:putative RNA-binding protein n=1 Tax=Trypanosoma grayi TaxID=71804 RepID=UPI0004F4097D|nr:putative RNA-binding protein [Trypanosoma grayi]KEG09542.1 putative RNA-binding protein [Trypanosoma grayi]
MEDNLAAEIARIEAELEVDRQLREQQRQQQQQQQQTKQQQPFGFQGVVSAFGASPAQQQQQQQQQPQQQGGINPTPGHRHHQQQQQPQQQHVAPGASAPTSGQPHQFSKDSDSRSIFVGNLPKGENGGPTSTPEELVQFFSDCGQILNCTLLRDRTTGELKGTAYMEFASYTSMGKAIDTKNNANFKGSTIIVC